MYLQLQVQLRWSTTPPLCVPTSICCSLMSLTSCIRHGEFIKDATSVDSALLIAAAHAARQFKQRYGERIALESLAQQRTVSQSAKIDGTNARLGAIRRNRPRRHAPLKAAASKAHTCSMPLTRHSRVRTRFRIPLWRGGYPGLRATRGMVSSI